MASTQGRLIITRVLLWLLFAVVLALVPVVFNIITAASHNQSLTFTNLLSRGIVVSELR